MNYVKCFIPVFLIALALSCKNDEPTELPPIEEEPIPLIPLEGTEWILAGIVDVATGEVTEPEPKDCAECYTLLFDKDTIGRIIHRQTEWD
ncbi:MAG: hypothetical protein LBT83_10520 [Tannerella sp.]|jgi:hypothetical protein|nr:hypothetical protein [Tannerella sp.]